MKPLEILLSLPQWKKATAEALVDSPAFALPCRLGDEPVQLRPAPIEPAVSELLGLSVSFGDEPHTLGLARSPRFPELNKLWDTRAGVPEPILLALVEKECGPLFQLLENAVRKQLRLVGLDDSARSDVAAPRPFLNLCVSAPSREETDASPICFTLTRTPTVVAALGVLRNLDLTHEAIRSEQLSAVAEYAAFTMPDADLASLASGDAVVVSEIGTVPPRWIVDGRFALDGGGVSPSADDALVRVRAAESATLPLGAVLDAAEGKVPDVPALSDGSQLRLVRGGRTCAIGSLGRVGDQPAFLVESLATDR